MRTPLVVMAVLAVVLLGLDAAFGGSSPAPPDRRAPVSTIAKRVAALRGLAWKTPPRAQAVTPAQARRDGLAEFDRSYPAKRLAADEQMLHMLGLLPREATLRGVMGDLFEQGVAGYYEPRTKRLRVVSSAATGTRVLEETVLAHELTHALEDQHYGLLDEQQWSDDAALAQLALVEGTATDVMERYQRRYFSAEEALAGTLAGAFAGGTGSMPPFLGAQAVFPYVGGLAFVDHLVDRAGGRWNLVDLADRVRPPASTEQVLHPERYLRADAPKRVAPLGLGRVLGPGWRRLRASTWGELQTREMLLGSGGGGSARAAAGWGGDRWELWSGPAGDVLAMRWVWDTPRDRREFAARLRVWAAYARSGADAPAVDVTARRGAVTLALAPDRATAERAARSGYAASRRGR